MPINEQKCRPIVKMKDMFWNHLSGKIRQFRSVEIFTSIAKRCNVKRQNNWWRNKGFSWKENCKLNAICDDRFRLVQSSQWWVRISVREGYFNLKILKIQSFKEKMTLKEMCFDGPTFAMVAKVKLRLWRNTNCESILVSWQILIFLFKGYERKRR